ncbi:exported hypothetical protein [Candidatus Nitrospira nitrificans]|uniref:Uncharacterized protein n=1 Tax=Candidatus Nitrospira nitrificans TaxID=1742973 RepID=A0A0S4LDE8_9BACT|nr:exported hypothetical protein [Candidatus Nitrospira nitrificans]
MTLTKVLSLVTCVLMLSVFVSTQMITDQA